MDFFKCFFFSENLASTVINLNVSKLPEVVVSKCSFCCIVSTHYTGLESNALHSATKCPVLNKCQSSLLFLSGELVPFTWDFRIVCILTTKTVSERWERRWMECWSTQLLSMMCMEFSYASPERWLFSALGRAGGFPSLWWWSQKLLWNVWEKLLKNQIIFVFYISNLQITVFKHTMFMQKKCKIIFIKFLNLNIPVNSCYSTRSVCPWEIILPQVWKYGLNSSLRNFYL